MGHSAKGRAHVIEGKHITPPPIAFIAAPVHQHPRTHLGSNTSIRPAITQK